MLLRSILVHPDSQEPINVNWEDKKIFLGEDNLYRAGFNQGVPYLLPGKVIPAKISKIHEDHQSEFHYQDHYQQDAEVFDYFQEFSSRVDQCERIRLNEMIVSRIPQEVSSILDVGCGNGWLAKAMVNETRTIISMDISSRNPVEAVKQNPHHRHEALIADVYHLPLKENSIDCVTASEIMEHVPDPALFVEKLLYVLKPGGKLIITTPYDEKIQYHLCVHCNRPTPAHAHLHSFNENNIERLIPKTVGNWEWQTFSHKYMSKTRLYQMMSTLPFGVWRIVDKMANKGWRRPMRLMIEVIKK